MILCGVLQEVVATAVPRKRKSRSHTTRLDAAVLERPSVSVRAPGVATEEEHGKEVRNVKVASSSLSS